MEPIIKLGEKISWFPGHMYRATRLLKENISKIDIFVEVRDARVPISSRNDELDQIIEDYHKPKLIVFNKFDLCHHRSINRLIDDLNKAKIPCLALSAQLGTNVKNIIEHAKKTRPPKYSTVGMWMMIGGMPNVGKSSIINKIRNTSMNLDKQTSIAKAGPLPCVTRGVTGFKISQEPLAYLVDTPGIMVPRIVNDEVGLKLALVGCIKDSIVGKDIILEFMLKFLNKQKQPKYMELYDILKPLKLPSDLCNYVMDKYQHNNLNTTYDLILSHFREGKLGHMTLDDIPTE